MVIWDGDYINFHWFSLDPQLFFCSGLVVQVQLGLRHMRIQRKSVSEISKPPFSKSNLSLLTRSVPLESCVSLLSRYTTRFVFPTRFRFEIQRNLQRHSLKNAKLTVGSVFWVSNADVITIPNHHIAILSRENCQSSKTTWKAHALQFWSDSDQKYDFHKIVRN